jgi:3-oxoacyl-[acyl-carrier-protein] synthase II
VIPSHSPRRRVAITGVGLLCPIGNSVAEVTQALKKGLSGVRYMSEWDSHDDLNTRVGAPVCNFDERSIPREYRRSMGRLALIAAAAVEQAIADSKLDANHLRSGRLGLSIGQTVGSPLALQTFFDTCRNEGFRGLKSTTFLQLMNHSASANIALRHGITGRVWAPASACASSSQAVGQGYETIRDGYQDAMICGGSEELHSTTAAVFDIVGGTSRAFNNSPEKTPRPFDKARDGLVVGEAAAVVVLEDWESARRRNAPIWGEVLGFATGCDGVHISAPAREGMARTMAEALKASGLTTKEIDYVNAHATGTPLGDATEAKAAADIYGDRIPISSTKGHTGHTLAACGSMEVIFCLTMMRHRFIAPTLNLTDVDPECSGLRHVREVEEKTLSRVMSNNFAFGGVNTSLVLAAPQ